MFMAFVTLLSGHASNIHNSTKFYVSMFLISYTKTFVQGK